MIKQRHAFIALGLTLVALSPALADDVRDRNPAAHDQMAPRLHHAAPFDPSGIEGNGLLGIEGNGIVQRLDTAALVLNDRLFLLGAGNVRVTVDAATASLNAIAPGHVLLAAARTPAAGATPTLAAIKLDHLIRGPVVAGGINLDEGTIEILGQTLQLPNYAAIADTSGDLKLEDLADGDYLRVSGWLDDNGEVLATRLERRAPLPNTLEVSGRVSELDTVAGTLHIGDLTVDYSSAQFIFMTPQELAIDATLEVVGSALTMPGTLTATRVRQAPPPLGAVEGQEAELQGFVEQTLGGNEFVVAGQTVLVSVQTEYRRGAAAEVLPGRLVEIEGLINGAGELLADRVEFDEEILEAEIRIFGIVESVDPSTASFQIFGLTTSTNVATRYEDKTDSGSSFTGFDDLAVGDFVELRGYDEPDGSNMLAASRIERDLPDTTSLKARVTANSGSAIAVLGLDVLTDTSTEFEDLQGNSIDELAFVSLAQVGVLIRATGVPVPGGIDATRLQIE